MEAAVVLLGIFYAVSHCRSKAAQRYGEGQTAAYGRAIVRETEAALKRATKPQPVSWDPGETVKSSQGSWAP